MDIAVLLDSRLLSLGAWGYDSRLNAILSTKLMNNTLYGLVSDCG
ncbi:hypothetical protein [Candidatus Nitrosocosmicus sp. T]